MSLTKESEGRAGKLEGRDQLGKERRGDRGLAVSRPDSVSSHGIFFLFFFLKILFTNF